jgi:23S rRNA (guanine745-N1)-methyltransferase
MMPDALACSVRDCYQPLSRRANVYGCDRGHTFDVARSGYVNLLQPQDRRSAEPGDSREAVAARARLLANGIGRAVIDAVAATAVDCLPDQPADRQPPVVVDLGCGAGDLLADLATRAPIAGIGIDLSAEAAETAARRHPALTWVVANADRRLPLLDASVDLVLSLHGRRNPAECARVLTTSGRLIVAVPSPDDLAELRALVQGEATARDRSAAVVAEHEQHFVLAGRQTAREHHGVTDRALLTDLLSGTYRGGRHRTVPADDASGAFGVTLASDVLLFARRIQD